MMQKHYIFIIMIIIIFYLSYSIINFTINEHKINQSINEIQNLINDLNVKIEDGKGIIEYKTSKAYKNKILKDQQSYKNIGENVFYFTSEDDFNRYTKIEEYVEEEVIVTKNDVRISDFSIFEKWMYFLFEENKY